MPYVRSALGGFRGESHAERLNEAGGGVGPWAGSSDAWPTHADERSSGRARLSGRPRRLGEA